MLRRLALVPLIALLVAYAPASVSAVRTGWSIVELGASTTWSQAFAVNDHGLVVGSTYLSSGEQHAALWEDGVMTDLGTLGEPRSWASGINNRGQVVGTSYVTPGTDVRHAFLWEDGVMTDLGTLPGGESSGADAIAENGLIAGWVQYGTTFNGGAALWDASGDIVDLGTLGGWGAGARDLNARGQVVGDSNAVWGDAWSHAFVWEDGVMKDLGLLGAQDAFAHAINARGQIVGSSADLAGHSHAILWQDGELIDLGSPYGSQTFSAEAISINDRGQIVGSTSNLTDPKRAFVWDDGEWLLLDSLDGGSCSATDINNRGDVVGYCRAAPDVVHAVMWTK